VVVDEQSRRFPGEIPPEPAARPPHRDGASSIASTDRTPQDPPYLLTASPRGDGVGVTVTGDASTAVVELTAHGSWSPQLGEQVAAQLRLCLAGPATTIIVELRHMSDPYAVSLPFWLAAWRQARLEAAPAHLVFCLPVTTALSGRFRSRQGPQPRVYATVSEARIAIAERASRADRFQARLAPSPASVGTARDLVAQACHAWSLPQLKSDSTLVVSELAANAVEHAGTEFVATVTRSGTGLYLAVRDSASRFPHPSELRLTGPQLSYLDRGRGLRLVHAIAARWGTMPAHAGKVVWASVNG
jgi:anti-sigma regulatory factor (Ser/Thr protein kinase)